MRTQARVFPLIASLLLMAFMATPSFAQYSARRNGDIVQLEDTKNQIVVSILPSIGNITIGMKVKGQDVLRWPYTSVEEFKTRPSLSGIPFLGPWANRLDEQAFYANGKKYPFDMTLGNIRGAIPIHGFVSTTDQWQVVEVRSDGKAAWVTSKLEFFRQPLWMKQFPFAHTIETTHRLENGVLEIRTKVTNMAAEPMPLAIGFHPYYQLTDSPREEWTISVPARTWWQLAPNKVPTGETQPAEKLFPDSKAAALKDYNLDDVFSDLVRDAQGKATVTLQGKHQRLDIILGSKWRSLVLYSPNPSGTGLGSNIVAGANLTAPRGNANPAASNFICFEPMAGITDAMNLAQKGLYKELQSIPPGGSWQESFWIKPSGF
jgi:aldose 1-epimerase